MNRGEEETNLIPLVEQDSQRRNGGETKRNGFAMTAMVLLSDSPDVLEGQSGIAKKKSVLRKIPSKYMDIVVDHWCHCYFRIPPVVTAWYSVCGGSQRLRSWGDQSKYPEPDIVMCNGHYHRVRFLFSMEL